MSNPVFFYFAENETDSVYIQGRRNESETVWRYNDGIPMIFFRWNSDAGQPSNGPMELYIGMMKSYGYRWHAIIDDNTVHAVVCQQS